MNIKSFLLIGIIASCASSNQENTLSIDANNSKILTPPVIYFAIDKYEISQKDKSFVDEMVSSPSFVEIKKIRGFASCDNNGPVDYNLALSKKRANAVESLIKNSSKSKNLNFDIKLEGIGIVGEKGVIQDNRKAIIELIK